MGKSSPVDTPPQCHHDKAYQLDTSRSHQSQQTTQRAHTFQWGTTSTALSLERHLVCLFVRHTGQVGRAYMYSAYFCPCESQKTCTSRLCNYTEHSLQGLRFPQDTPCSACYPCALCKIPGRTARTPRALENHREICPWGSPGTLHCQRDPGTCHEGMDTRTPLCKRNPLDKLGTSARVFHTYQEGMA